MRVDNAIILAAGTSSRFVPLSCERHKALTVVKGDVLIERQIQQLKEAGIPQIYIVTGYKAEQFDYLIEKHNVKLIQNSDYLSRNNNGSIWAAKSVLQNSYVCSSDNYFCANPFEAEVDDAYYAAEYADDITTEWCMTEDEEGFIDSVSIGGNKAWYMFGHTFWSSEFSSRFLKILEIEYNRPETADKLWESIFMEHLDVLKMQIKKYSPGIIYEFDTLDELREFDNSYLVDTRSEIIKRIAATLDTTEEQIIHIVPLMKNTIEAIGFEFDCMGNHYSYQFESGELKKTI